MQAGAEATESGMRAEEGGVSEAAAPVRERTAMHLSVLRAAAGVHHDDHVRVVRALAEAQRLEGVAVHAWVLLPESLQLTISPACGQGERAFMLRWVECHRALSLAERGHPGGDCLVRWQGVPVDVETHLFVSQLYVERLPVKSGLTVSPWAWRWSSHHANAYGEADACVTPHRVYQQLGRSPAARAEAYRALFELDLDPRLWEATEQALAEGRPLASAAAMRHREARTR